MSFEMACRQCGRKWPIASPIEAARIFAGHECPSPFEGTPVGAA